MYLTGPMLATVVLFSLPHQQDETAPEAEMRKLQGTWKLISGEYNGGELPDDTLRTTKLTIVKKQYRLSVKQPGPKTELIAEISLNSEKSPKEIDLGFGKGAERGIYMVVGDFLFLVFRTGDERPKAFNSPSGSLHQLYLFKRQAPR